MSPSATPATQNEGGCEIVPRLPRETNVDVTKCHACHAKCRGVTRDQSGPKRATQCHECHACHAKRRWMWDCATPATWNERRCHQVPRLPTQSAAASRATKAGPSAPPSAMSATPATQNEGGCETVRRLPRETNVDVTKCHACHAKCRGVTRDQSGPKRATHQSGPKRATHAVPWVPRLPRKTKVDVRLCHACHVKRT